MGRKANRVRGVTLGRAPSGRRIRGDATLVEVAGHAHAMTLRQAAAVVHRCRGALTRLLRPARVGAWVDAGGVLVRRIAVGRPLPKRQTIASASLAVEMPAAPVFRPEPAWPTDAPRDPEPYPNGQEWPRPADMGRRYQPPRNAFK